jgi:hypothetical protein
MKHSIIIDLLIRPGAFFQNVINERENLNYPALIVLVGGIAGAMYGYLIGGLTGQLMDGIIPGMGTIIILTMVFGALIAMIISMVFLLWRANIWIFGMQHCASGYRLSCIFSIWSIQ